MVDLIFLTGPSLMPDTPIFSDIVVAGAGIAGASCALALKRSLGALVSVTLCDPVLAGGAEPGPRRSMRAVAVAPDAQRSLEDLGVWREIADQAQPIRSMAITDSRAGAVPNPIYLSFDGAAVPDGILAHMIFTEDLRRALLRACSAAGVRFEAGGVSHFKAERHGLTLTLPDGGILRTRLLAAADGGRSRLRHAASIQSFGGSYPQSAIVATIRHEESHRERAVQHFLAAGPLALLPMRAADGSPHRASIVWTETTAEAKRLAALPAPAFLEALHDRIGYEYGGLELEDQPVAFPLGLSLARRLTGPRIALLGDAARVIHPLAGQGLNLGLRDAVALAARVTTVASLGLDPGGADVLAGYERDRQLDSAAMAAMTDLMNRLFSNDRLPLRLLRDVGLGLVDRMPLVKRRLIGGATGATALFEVKERADAPAAQRAQERLARTNERR